MTEGQTDIGIVAGLVRTENLETLPYRRDRLVLEKLLPRGHAGRSGCRSPFADTLIWTMWARTNRAHPRLSAPGQDQLHRPIKQRIQVSNF